MGGRRLLVFAALALGTASMAAIQRDANAEGAVEQEFQASVAAYVAVRNLATASLPSLESSQRMEKIQQVMSARHAAVAAARPAARTGDLFSPRIAALFRARIRAALADQGITELQALDIINDEVSEDAPSLEVNDWFPWEYGSMMLPCVLQALPPLPPGLEYRFVDTALVLVDVDATLIVDILPDVLRDGIYA